MSVAATLERVRILNALLGIRAQLARVLDRLERLAP